MHSITKKIVSLLGIFIVSSGVATSLVLKNSLKIPSFTFSEQKLNFFGENLNNSNSLNLENNYQNSLSLKPLNNSKTLNSQDLNIKDKLPNSLDMGIPINSELQFKIKETLSEVNKEAKLQKIERRSRASVQLSKSKINQDELKALKTATQKYKDYSSLPIKRTGRRKRSVDDVESRVDLKKPNLDEQERRSLSKFYGEFVKLNELKDMFSEEIKENVNYDFKKDMNLEQEILNKDIASLKTMKWDNSDLQLFGGQYGSERKDILDPQRVRSWKNIDCQDDHCGWRNWEENPYKNFFKNEDEWKQFITNITAPQQKILENLDNPRKIACNLLFFPGVNNFVSYYGILWFIRKAYIRQNGSSLKQLNEGDCGIGEQHWLFRNIQEAKTDLQFKIGSTLMNRMNLLS